MRKFFFIFLFIIAGLSYLFQIDELLIKKFTFLNDFKVLNFAGQETIVMILEKLKNVAIKQDSKELIDKNQDYAQLFNAQNRSL